MNYADKMFYRGFAAAIASLARASGSNEPKHAANIAFNNGIRLHALKEAQVDPFDLHALEPAMMARETRDSPWRKVRPKRAKRPKKKVKKRAG